MFRLLHVSHDSPPRVYAETRPVHVRTAQSSQGQGRCADTMDSMDMDVEARLYRDMNPRLRDDERIYTDCPGTTDS